MNRPFLISSLSRGQRDILETALQYVEGKRQEAVDLARENGVEIVLEDD